MFEKIRKCLDNMENIFNKFELTKEEESYITYYNLHLAEALMDCFGDADKIAKVILVHKDKM